MGNCVCYTSRRNGGVTTGDDEDGVPVVWADQRGETMAAGEERKTTKSVKVTVRVSKSRLQKLMASEAAGGREGMTTLGEVLAEIVSAGGVVVDDGRHRRRGWEPALESIPEAMNR